MNWKKSTGDAGLDEAIMRANPKYGHEGDYTVSGLCMSPRQWFLFERNEPTPSTIEHIDRTFGLMLHRLMHESGAPGLREHSLKATINGRIVSARLDCLNDGLLTEYRYCSVHARNRYLNHDRPRHEWDLHHEWTRQINLQAALCRLNNVKIERAEVRAIYKDWFKSRAGKSGHPEYQSEAIAAELLPRNVAHDLLVYRVNLFKSCEKKKDDKLPKCTDNERWLEPGHYEVWRQGNKSMSGGKHATENSASDYIRSLKTGGTYDIRHVPEIAKKCVYHCVVAPYCNQYLDGRK